MKVVPITTNKSFTFHGPRAEQSAPEGSFNKELEGSANKGPKGLLNEVPDWLIVLAGLGLTAWLPTLVWSLIINHNLPIYLIGSSEMLGSLIGYLFYGASWPALISCVPVTSMPAAPSVRRFKKAA